MSDPKTRSFTMRLSPEDQAALAQLCDLYGLDRPASIRQAIRESLVQRIMREPSGYFVPIGPSVPTPFPVRLIRKSGHE